MSPRGMQQRMMKQRQAALERQRSASRNRLGASVVAQANPLAQPPRTLKLPSYGLHPLEGPPSATPAPRTSSKGEIAAQSEEAANQPVPLNSGRSQGRGGGDAKAAPLENVGDCMAVEEMFDECILAAGPGVAGSAGAEEEPTDCEPRGRGGANEAWGGAGGLVRDRSCVAAPGVVTEEVSGFTPLGERHPEQMPRGGRRRQAPGAEPEEVQSFDAPGARMKSWDLDVGAEEPRQEAEAVQAIEGAGADQGRRGRRWWKPWSGGGKDPRGDQQEEARPGSRRDPGPQEASNVTTITPIGDFTD